MSTINAVSRDQVVALAAELERRSKSARDFIVPAKAFRLGVGGTDEKPEIVTTIPLNAFPGDNSMTIQGLTNTAHNQTAAKLGIPTPYYKRMLSEAPTLLAQNVNTWAEKTPKNWMLRTLDGNVRANVSDSYRALDNHDLFFSIYKVASDAGAEIIRATLTDDRFEVRMIHPEWRAGFNLKDLDGRGGHWYGNRDRGDGGNLAPGLYFRHSETGLGGLLVSPFLLDGICDNGVILEQSYGKVHLGARNTELGAVVSSETRKMADALVWAEVADVARSVFDRDKFDALIAALSGEAAKELAEPIEAVDAVVKNFGLTEDDKAAILNELVSPSHDRDPGRTIFGLISAVTERAKAYRDDDPEKASDMEARAGALLARPVEYVNVR